MKKFMLSLIVGLLVFSGGKLFAAGESEEGATTKTPKEKFEAAQALGLAQNRVGAVQALKILGDAATLTPYYRSQRCHLIYWWDSSRTHAEKLAWLKTLPADVQATKIVQKLIAHAEYKTGDLTAAKTTAEANEDKSTLALISLKRGDKAAAYGIYRDQLLTGKRTPKGFLAVFTKLELLSMSVADTVHLKTLRDVKRFCPPAGGNYEKWIDNSVMLTDKIAAMAESVGE